VEWLVGLLFAWHVTSNSRDWMAELDMSVSVVWMHERDPRVPHRIAILRGRRWGGFWLGLITEAGAAKASVAGWH
jgi:hypothetical protein